MSRKLVLQDFLPYLLNRAGLRIGLMFSRDIEPFGVTLPMWRVMIELWHHGDRRLGELSERTSIDISTLSRLLVGMQRKQLIVRRRSGLDGRALSLTLTGRGIELTQRIVPLARRYEEIAMQGMSEMDVAALKRLLETVYRNLAAADAAPARPAAGRKPRAARRAVKALPASRTARSSA
jgi:DNA-binding MarR family transcriptional regulator